MKKKLLYLTLLFCCYQIFSQEPVRSEKLDSIAIVLQNSTKGVRYVLSDTGINSELAEIGTTFFKNKYIILSNKKRRHAPETVNPETNIPNKNLYCVDVDESGNLSFPLLFSKAINADGDEGSISFSPDQKTIYFTQESLVNPGVYELYKATLDIESKEYWTNITKLNVSDGDYSVETPSISSDGKKIFFSSNKPGGFGGYDIYQGTILEDGNISNVKNLGANVNTSKDEKYPHITPDNNYLYFSSKGHLNLGGFDVFRSSVPNNEYLEALNLGNTLNSRKDDLAFVLFDQNKGYISTDKSGSGNYDILKFEIRFLENRVTPFTIVEKKSQLVLPNAKVTVKDEFGNLVAQTVSDKNGKINLEIKPISYNFITVEKEGYEPFVTRFTSENIILTKIELKQLKAQVTEDAVVIENILFDYDKAVIKKESELSLNKIVEVLSEKPELRLAINAHSDNKGSDKYNMALSQRRAKSTFDYLVKNGVAKDRLTYKGFGETQLLFDCTDCTPEQDQANRRVEFKIIKLEATEITDTTEK